MDDQEARRARISQLEREIPLIREQLQALPGQLVDAPDANAREEAARRFDWLSIEVEVLALELGELARRQRRGG
jgi:hypothetical protein